MSDSKYSLRRHAGRILYHRGDKIAGREDFAIDVRKGSRTIRAYCEMEEGALTRDASWTLGGDMKPLEGHVRVVQAGKQTGSAWYRFTEDEVECEALTATLGRTSQRLPSRARYLGLHPLIGDGMIALARGTGDPGREEAVESVTCSYDINGETSLVALPIDIGATFVGKEELTVPAGSFTADRYALRWQPQWPAADLWVHGEDAVFLRLDWSFSGLSSRLERYDRSDTSISPQFHI
jgi:hypothetical protein